MQFILKDNYIHIVNNTGLANHNIEADVIVKYVEDYSNKSFKYSINGGMLKDLVDEKIVIDKTELTKPYIDLQIKAIKDGDVETFKVERVPLTYAVIFGQSIEDAYPHKLRELENKYETVKQTTLELLDYVKEIEKKGKLL